MIISSIKEKTAERADYLLELDEIYGREEAKNHIASIYPEINHDDYCRIFQFTVLNSSAIKERKYEDYPINLYIGNEDIPNKCTSNLPNEDTPKHMETIMKFADTYKEQFQNGLPFGTILNNDKENIFNFTPSLRENFIRQTQHIVYGKNAKTKHKFL